jgi:diguanylate cyclase (GGDEF)-like protein/PAS domain S-box-containing protein
MQTLARLRQRVTEVLPVGMTLPREAWEPRHRWIVRLLWAHVPALAIFSFLRGNGVLHTAVEVTPLITCALAAKADALSPRVRSCFAGSGLMIASAVLVHLGGGRTEMHFHFFVMLPVISLYQEWRPFLISVGFVALHHGIVGVVSPLNVFDNPAAIQHPILWAGIHAAFVLAASAVCIASWRLIEDSNRAARARLEESERRFRALVENATDVVTVCDANGVITYDSPSSERVLGYPSAERVGTHFAEQIHQADAARTAGVIDHVIRHGGTVNHVELRVRHHDGSYRWIDASITNLLDDPAVHGLVGNFRDITDRKQLEDELSHQAFHDPLTGLANRALLLDRAEQALGRRRSVEEGVALLFLDLDDFKTVNDGLGHDAGDEILRITAKRIAAALRPGDTASRLGGDEFAVLLERIPNPDVAYEVGSRVLEAVCMPIEMESGYVAVHGSLGIAVSDGTEDAASLLRNADLAMYRAKGEGKSRFEIYEESMHAAIVERMRLKADLRRAVEASEFEAYYQPIVDLKTNRYSSVEALVRWNHPSVGIIQPLSFIPLAEETGHIVAIGAQILRQACADLASWQTAYGDRAPGSVAVNLSPRQLQSTSIIDDVEAALSASGLPASSLVLEITEGVLLEDTESVATTLGALKDLGVRIALDDFGTGYSSLSYLDRFPVDVVKIDKSFIDSLDSEGAPPSSLVSAIVNLGAVLGLDVTAEGIEQPHQLDRLKALGCAQGQGYLFARPVPAAQFVEQLTADRPTPLTI